MGIYERSVVKLDVVPREPEGDELALLRRIEINGDKSADFRDLSLEEKGGAPSLQEMGEIKAESKEGPVLAENSHDPIFQVGYLLDLRVKLPLEI